MTNNEIVQKLWNLCNVLRDDGITYHEYVTELTYILFLKMVAEQDNEESVGIPEEYRWNNLVKLDGLELKNTYQKALIDLGQKENKEIKELESCSIKNYRKDYFSIKRK